MVTSRRLGSIVVASSVSLISLQALAQKPNAAAKFTCDSRKTIVATFYSEWVQLNLSDGRRLNLPQVMSGSGARYANKDETFVFWNKGDTAFVTEGLGR